MKHLLFAAVFFCFAFPLCGQQVQLNEPPAVANLMRVWTDANRNAPRIKGWRVQLLSSTERKQVEEGKARFRSLFPDIYVDWVHEKPYYKLRAGAFLTKLEAMSLINDLKTAYPGAYPAQDNNIHPREFFE